MAEKVRFIRKNGRIIPIRSKNATKTVKKVFKSFKKPSSVKGLAVITATGFASQKIRQVFAEKITGSKSLGNPTANIAADVGISAGLVKAIHKVGSSKTKASIELGALLLRRGITGK